MRRSWTTDTMARRCAGTTLLEILAYVFLLAVIINLAAGVFVTSSRMSALGSAAAAKLRAIQSIRNDFTAAVKASTAVSPEVASYKTSGEQVVLTMAPGTDGEKRYCIFGHIGEEPRLSKLVLAENGGVLGVDRFVTYPVDLESMAFQYGNPGRLVSLDIALKRPEPKAIPGKGTPPTVRSRAVPAAHRFTAAFRSVEP